jgi:hypothetical protein
MFEHEDIMRVPAIVNDPPQSSSPRPTTSTMPTTYSSSSRDKDTIAKRNTMDHGDSYSSKLAELSPGPALLGERQQSESVRSETTARSRLASEIKWLKCREATKDGTSFHPDDDYDNDDEFYSESLDSFVKFRYSVIL